MKTKIIELLSNSWRESGVNSGDTLLVHSSLGRIIKKVRTETGYSIEPLDILQSLLVSLGEGGTLLLPLFNFDFAKGTPFDIRHTPSHMGVLTEIARSYPGVIRTGHPIYSFGVIGKHAPRFKEINNFSGYGADSPFSILKELKGKVAIIDLTDQNSMTAYHYVEESNNVAYRYHKVFTGKYTDQYGNSSIKSYGLFVRRIEDGVKTDVNRMMELLWQKGLYKGFKPGESFGMRTIEFIDFCTEVDKIIKDGRAIDFLYSIEAL